MGAEARSMDHWPKAQGLNSAVVGMGRGLEGAPVKGP